MTATLTSTQPGRLALALLVSALMLVASAARAQTQATPPPAGTETTSTETMTPGDDPVVLRSNVLTLTRSDFDARFRVAIANVLAQQGQPLIPELMAQFESLRPQYLEDLAFQAALLDEAERRGLDVPEEELEARLEQARQNFGGEEEYLDALSQAGFDDEAQFRETVRESERIQLVITALREEVETTEEEVAAFYADNQEQFARGEEVCSRHILVETLEEAEALAAELTAGADFAELAQEHSLDPGSAQRGGDLGCQPRGLFVPEFEEAAFTTPLDEVSEPVETQFGYHLIQPYDRTEAGVATLEEVEDEIRQQLQGERLNERVFALRDEADVEIFPENLTAQAPAAPAEAESEETGEDPEGSEEDTEEDTEEDAEDESGN